MQTNKQLDLQKEHVNFIEESLKHYHVPGLSLSLVRNDEELAQGFGQVGPISDPTQQPASPDETSTSSVQEHVSEATLFNIGSLTKGFTSAVLSAVLQQQRSVSWDTPIRRILGEDFEFCDGFRTEKACLRDLLAHKMGFELGELDITWLLDPMTREEMVMRMKHLPQTSDFRTKFYYNNLMYGLAGYVAEKITGQSWEELVKNMLFHPIGMTDSGFINEVGPPWENMAVPHVKTGPNRKLTPLNRNIHQSVGFVGPCGSVVSSARDMVKWMRFHLSQGEVDGIPIISKQYLSECYKPQFALPGGKPEWSGFVCKPDFPVTESRSSYGFAWYNGTYRGYRVLGHSGELFGYDALLTLYPDMKIGIYTATNGPGGADSFLFHQLLHYYLADILLGEQPWLDTHTICTFPQPWSNKYPYNPQTVYIPVDPTLPPSRSLTEYVGVYQHGFLGKMDVAVSGETLCLSYGKNGKFELYPNGEEDEFRMKSVGILEFLTEADMFCPTTWMTVKFVPQSDGQKLVALYCSLFESGPKFDRVK